MPGQRKRDNGGQPAGEPTGDGAAIVPVGQVQTRILTIRGQRVILDADLAELYGVTTARLNEQVKRNLERFPADFAFRLCREEYDNLMSHFATSSSTWGGRRKLPYVFTEHGAIMAASVLNSDHAVQTSVFVVRAFVQLRRMLAPYKELMARLEHLEKTVGTHDGQITTIVDAIRQLMPPPEEPPKEPFGFHPAKAALPEFVPFEPCHRVVQCVL